MSFFSDLKTVLEQDAAASVLPVLVTDLQDIKANPADYINPLTAQVKALKLFADVQNALPAFEKSSVSDLAGLLITYVQKVQQPAAAAAAAATLAPKAA